MPTPITIECFTDGTTSITHRGLSYTRAPFTEAFIQTQAKAILKGAHYNECFSIQVKQNSESARAQAEADKLATALKTEIGKVSHLNLAIEGQEPHDWAQRKIETNKKQMAILREAAIVAARIRSYPNSAGTPEDLKHLAEQASPKALLEAKDFIITSQRPRVAASNRPTDEGTVHAAAYLTAFFVVSIVMSIMLSPIWLIGAGVIAFMGVGFLAATIFDKRANKHFNSETGSSEMVEKMQQLSPDFLKSLQPDVSQINPASSQPIANSSTPEATTVTSSPPSQEKAAPSSKGPSQNR